MNKKNTSRICKVTDIQDIEDYEDFQRIILDHGWQVVVEKDQYKLGDEVMFIPAGSWIPNTLVELTESGEYKGIKGGYLPVMRRSKEISEGIVLSADKYDSNLEIRVWERDLPEDFKIEKYRTYPHFIPKVQYEHAQNLYSEIFEEHYDESFEITPRLDGVEMSVYVRNGRFGICSDRYDIDENANSEFWKLAYELNLIDPMIEYRDQYVIHGTILGKGIYNNRERIFDKTRFYIHDIYDIEKSAFSASRERYKIFSDLAEYCKFHHVDVFKHSMPISEIASDMRQLVDYANGPSIAPLAKRRGLVFKSTKSDFSFKVRSNNFCIANRL
jgi:RNA ligase (TIGR02306 family)